MGLQKSRLTTDSYCTYLSKYAQYPYLIEVASASPEAGVLLRWMNLLPAIP